MARKSSKSDPRHFEASFEKLKGIVSQLENGKLTLSQSLEKYEEGIKSLKECYDALNLAQIKIQQLVKLDENGKLITKPFDDTATFDPAASSQFGAVDSSYSASGQSGKKVDASGKTSRKRRLDEDDLSSSRPSTPEVDSEDSLYEFETEDEEEKDSDDYNDPNSLF